MRKNVLAPIFWRSSLMDLLASLFIFACATSPQSTPIEMRTAQAKALKKAYAVAQENGFKIEETLVHITVGSYANQEFSNNFNWLCRSLRDKEMTCRSELITEEMSYQDFESLVIKRGKEKIANDSVGFMLYQEATFTKHISDEDARHTRGGVIFVVIVDLASSKLVSCEKIRFK